MRNFDNWIKGMRNVLASWNYYTDFDKIYRNIEDIKIELNILNSLIGSKKIEEDFKKILKDYPQTLKVIPILLAKREKEIMVLDNRNEYNFNFVNKNYTDEEYALFMKKTGLFELIENHIINNLVDYVMGVEVGLDSNGRKNRTGEIMEDLVESNLLQFGLIKGTTYYKELSKTQIEKMFNIDLSKMSNNGKTEKRFDFVVCANNKIYAIECNFYSGGGSKLNETARSYKNIALETKNIDNFKFVWITDGKGWHTARHNLEETFNILDDLYNINDLESGCLQKLIK